MKLYGTARSHFTRKVRLLLDHLDVDYVFLDIGNVADRDPAQFRGNPLMSVPVLEDRDVWLIDSDHIAQYISSIHDAQNGYGVFESDRDKLNARAVMNGVMANEVKLVLSKRTGLTPDGLYFFDKARAAIEQALAWLEARASMFDADHPTYAEFHFISMWEHLILYRTIEPAHPALERLSARLAESDIVRRSDFPPLPQAD